MKLPAADQRQYSQYVTSAACKADTRSKWDKFSSWMEELHDSAVQSSLMHMVDKSGGLKSNQLSAAKSSVTCSVCNGSGHYARNCPSRAKSGAGSSVRVNLAVVKVTTKADYNKYLPETKRDIGKCPACNQGPHNYMRTFPFGKAEWPSNRLESCTQFMALSARERGELVERVRGCYKCTSYKHQGDACFKRGKTNCTIMTAGSACSGIHHKSLHGSGVAFCHKVVIKANPSAASVNSASVLVDDMD